VNTWKVILATLVIFGSGVVTGGLLVSHSERVKLRQGWLQNRNQPSRPTRNEPRPAAPVPPGVQPPGAMTSPLLPTALRLDLLQRIERQIQLTPGQREKIEEILRDGQERSRQIMEPIQGELQKQVRVTRERIREVLTQDQQAKFDELMRPQRRFDESFPAERRQPRQPMRPLDGGPRLPSPGPRSPAPENP
jgi:hypothetical protein